MAVQEPTLLFFRSKPEEWSKNHLIASSMQSLETSFFMIALGRYAHALVTCASAIEVALQAADIGADIEHDYFGDLIKKAKTRSKKRSNKLVQFSDQFFPKKPLPGGFQDTRNRITHQGFTSQDISKTASLYLDVGWPFLSLCYEEFHSFNLMDGLLPEYAEHIDNARRVHELATELPDIDQSYCLRSFSHLIRWRFKQNFAVSWEVDARVHAEEIGVKFERTIREKESLESLFGQCWSFDCPICDGFDNVVGELDFNGVDDMNVEVKRMACVDCGFVVTTSNPFISQILLEKQIENAKPKILREYGVI